MQGLSSAGILSEATRKYLAEAFDRWQTQQNATLGNRIDDVQDTVQTAISRILRDMNALSNGCTAEHSTAAQQIGKVDRSRQETLKSGESTNKLLQKAAYRKLFGDMMCVILSVNRSQQHCWLASLDAPPICLQVKSSAN